MFKEATSVRVITGQSQHDDCITMCWNMILKNEKCSRLRRMTCCLFLNNSVCHMLCWNTYKNLLKIIETLEKKSLIKANCRIPEILYVFIKQLIESLSLKNEEIRFKGIKSSHLVVTNDIYHYESYLIDFLYFQNEYSSGITYTIF